MGFFGLFLCSRLFANRMDDDEWLVSLKKALFGSYPYRHSAWPLKHHVVRAPIASHSPGIGHGRISCL